MRTVCVVHLVWAPAGIEPFQRFLESLRRRRSGLPYRLLIVFNGFTAPVDLGVYERLLAGEAYDRLILAKPVQDIAAYLSAARASTADDICFLNSYTVLLHDDWLAKLHAPLHHDRVELVGATGSWESRYSDALVIDTPARYWWSPHGLRQAFYLRLAIARTRAVYPPFPNPHLRTNAFMISRARLLSEDFGAIRNKEYAYRFESGRDGLTVRIVRAGFQARVVDCQGRAWRSEEWYDSRTFRCGRQENLLIADNQTRNYEQADAATRRQLEKWAWGDKSDPAGQP
jgi:hypothetical protein